MRDYLILHPSSFILGYLPLKSGLVQETDKAYSSGRYGNNPVYEEDAWTGNG